MTNIATRSLDEAFVGRKVSEDLDVVNQVLNNRLGSDDLKRIVQDFNLDKSEELADKVVSLLGKTSALLEFSRKGAESLVLDVLLPKMVSLISDFLDAERTTIFLHDPHTKELFSWVAEGDLASEIRIPNNVGIAGHVFTSGEALLVEDAYADDRFNPDVDKKTGFRTRSIICVPIQHRASGTIGVIQVLNHRLGPFATVDLRLLESISSQVATGFENARLHDQIVRARNYEQKFIDVTTAISRELQLKPLLQKVMETVTVFLDADRSTLFLHDETTNELWSQVAQGVKEIRFPSHLGIAGNAFSSRQTINIPDAYADDRFNPEFDKKTGYQTRTILCMPVIAKSGDALGVIQVLNKNHGIFTPQDVLRLEAFCAQAAIAIENAKLFEEVVSIKNYNESILESMSNSVLTLNAMGEIVTANQAALKLLQSDQTGLGKVA